MFLSVEKVQSKYSVKDKRVCVFVCVSLCVWAVEGDNLGGRVNARRREEE